MTAEERRSGYEPEKVEWQRPKWIKNNKYCNKTFIVENVPIAERNVWNLKAPLVLKVDTEDYQASSVLVDFPSYSTVRYNSTNSRKKDEDWGKGVAAIIFFISIIVAILSAIFGSSGGGSSEPYDFSRDTEYEQRMQAEADKAMTEEEDRRQKEEKKAYEDYLRGVQYYNECRAAGYSEEDCFY